MEIINIVFVFAVLDEKAFGLWSENNRLKVFEFDVSILPVFIGADNEG